MPVIEGAAKRRNLGVGTPKPGLGPGTYAHAPVVEGGVGILKTLTCWNNRFGRYSGEA